MRECALPNSKPYLPQAAHWVLRASVALSAFAAAYVAYFHASAVNSYFFIEFGAPEASARSLDVTASIVLALAGALALVPRLRVVPVFASLVVASWFFSLALSDTALDGRAFSSLSLPAAALRISLPVALSLVLSGRDDWWPKLLQVAAAVTFATHGYEALCHNPKFVDLILLNLNPGSMEGDPLLSEGAAGILLTCIGVMDIACALFVLLLRKPALALYMACWGGITALSRMGALGLEAWPAAILRVSHFGAPLALFLIWRRRDIMKP
jgi:hypothetical protein